MAWRALRDNGAAAVSTVLLLVLGQVVTAMLSLIIKLMAMLLAWVGMYNLQHLLVGKRRCSGHWAVQYGATEAYYLPTPLVIYAAKALTYSSTSNINESTPFVVIGILVMFLFTTFGSTQLGVIATNMRAYSLGDRPRDRYNLLMWLVFLGEVEWEWARISRGPKPLLAVLQMFIHFGVVFCILFANTSESTLDCQTKAVADYMKRQRSSKSSSTSPFFDNDANRKSSLHLDCCRYPFVQRKNGEWVTIKDLVQRNDLPNEDQDIWLSYSLCRLLARRYYGFHCTEEGDANVRRFALADLGRTGGGYKRAFTIVEVQLAFLHDYFFTASLPSIESEFHCLHVAHMLMVALGTIIYGFFLTLFPPSPDGDAVATTETFVLATALSVFVSGCMTIGWPDLLAIYWRPIHTAFRKLNYYLLNEPHHIVYLVTLLRSGINPNVPDPFETQTYGIKWKNKIGQYSILQDYDRRRSLKKALVAWFQEIMLSQPSYEFIKHLPVEEEEVDMLELDNMRELVANTLRDIDGLPTNGTRSLKIYMDEISWGSADYDWLGTCRQETHTDTILIWHIATCYCDMSLRHPDLQEGFPRLLKTYTYHKVATTLSRYCAYLVAFLPEFLPEHSLTTKQVFQRVLQEAQGALGTTPMEEKEKYTKMQDLPLPHQTTFQKGVELGRQLDNVNDTHLRWKVMAEFWAETILYVAPSDNAEANIEHLAKGGEFITHLWAMLSNAGILKHATGEWHPPPASTNTEGPPTEALSSSIDEASTSSMSFLPRISNKRIMEDID